MQIKYSEIKKIVILITHILNMQFNILLKFDILLIEICQIIFNIFCD